MTLHRKPHHGEREYLTFIRSAIIMTLPPWTLFKTGWRTSGGDVQSSAVYRLGEGLGPTARDIDVRDRLRSEADWWPYHEGQDYGIQLLAVPAGCDLEELQTQVNAALDLALLDADQRFAHQGD